MELETAVGLGRGRSVEISLASLVVVVVRFEVDSPGLKAGGPRKNG